MRYSESPAVRAVSREATRGIYFLLKGAEVIYVGQGICVEVRIAAHVSAGRKDFDGVAVLPVPVGDLNAVELGYILKYLPRCNAILPPNSEWVAIETARKTVSPRPTRAVFAERLKRAGATMLTLGAVSMVKRKDIPR